MMVKCIVVTAMLLAGSLSMAQEDKTPLRKNYPGVKTIELDDFAKIYDKAIVVDVRSGFEFDVVHIAKAVNVPLSKMGFIDQLAKVAPKNGTATIVTYCNGYKCPKSFDAAKEAMAAGYKDILVLDAGVINWLKVHPDKAFLMGKSPADPKDVIEESDYKAKQISFEDMKKAETDNKAVFIDVRDPVQRSKKVDLKNLRSIPLDKMLKVLSDGQFKDNSLYFVDNVGKQNEWLEYHLKKHGYANYKFLKGGADALP